MALITLIVLLTQTIHPTIALLPFIWLPQLLLTAGLGYLVAGLTVFLRDIPQTVGLGLNLWFYLTPLVYPISKIPQVFQMWVLILNPIAAIAEIYRDLILVGEVRHWPEWGLIWGISVLVFYGGFLIYQRLRPAFADVL
jgi:lipopolysaccharide transport system permease protein